MAGYCNCDYCIDMIRSWKCDNSEPGNAKKTVINCLRIERKSRKELLAKAALVLQRQCRMKLFRRALACLKAEKEAKEEYGVRLMGAATMVQRVFRYRLFQRAFVKLKSEREAVSTGYDKNSRAASNLGRGRNEQREKTCLRNRRQVFS